MSSIKRSAFWLAILLTSLSACQKKATGPPPRYAVLRFENLTGDPALDWVGRGASESLSRMLDGASGGVVVGTPALARVNASLGRRNMSAPGISSERTAALGASANHVITGYVERAGSGLRLVVADEDLASHLVTRLISVTGKTVLEALTAAARALAEKPRSAPTASEGALRAWVEGVEAGGPEQGAQFQRAIAADAGFGPAWVSLVRVITQTDRVAATGLVEKALRQKLQPLDRAALEVERTELTGNRKSRVHALRQYAALSPGDVILLRGVAEQESVTGDFAESAADWQKVAAILPGDLNALNQAGYNFAWAGNFEQAVKVLREFAQRAPADANALDSLGDVNYWFGRYAEAAANYSAAHVRNPKMLGGGDLYKAAWAQFRAKDTKAADELFQQFLKFREDPRDAVLPALHGDWLYRTGRQAEGVELLRKESSIAPEPAGKAILFSGLAILELAASDRAAALRDLQSAGPVASPAILTARFAAMPTASAAEWESRARRLFAQPQLGPLRTAALGWALILDGKKDAAKTVWMKIVEDGPATDFFAREVVAWLKGEKVSHLAPPDPVNLNQFAAILSRP